MKYSNIILRFEKYSSLDIISASTDEPDKPVETTQNIDPYAEDKW